MASERCERPRRRLVRSIVLGLALSWLPAAAQAGEVVRFQAGFSGARHDGTSCDMCGSLAGTLSIGERRAILTTYELYDGGVRVQGDYRPLELPLTGGKKCLSVRARSQTYTGSYDTEDKRVCASLRRTTAGSYAMAMDVNKVKSTPAGPMSDGSTKPAERFYDRKSFAAELSFTSNTSAGGLACVMQATSRPTSSHRIEGGFTSQISGRPSTPWLSYQLDDIHPNGRGGTYCSYSQAELPF